MIQPFTLDSLHVRFDHKVEEEKIKSYRVFNIQVRQYLPASDKLEPDPIKLDDIMHPVTATPDEMATYEALGQTIVDALIVTPWIKTITAPENASIAIDDVKQNWRDVTPLQRDMEEALPIIKKNMETRKFIASTQKVS